MKAAYSDVVTADNWAVSMDESLAAHSAERWAAYSGARMVGNWVGSTDERQAGSSGVSSVESSVA